MINLDKMFKLKFSDGIPLQLNHIPIPISYKLYVNLGYIIYEIDRDNSRYIIHRLVITGKNQKEGYLKKSIEKLINEFIKKKEIKYIVINIKNTKIEAIEFCKNIGFKYNEKNCVYEIDLNIPKYFIS
jgi:hypothetical protein